MMLVGGDGLEARQWASVKMAVACDVSRQERSTDPEKARGGEDQNRHAIELCGSG
jgi:hypothetical protein